MREKIGKNRWHFDLAPPVNVDLHTEVDRLVALGAARLDDRQCEPGAVSMSDPDGNEFCVLTPL